MFCGGINPYWLKPRFVSHCCIRIHHLGKWLTGSLSSDFDFIPIRSKGGLLELFAPDDREGQLAPSLASYPLLQSNFESVNAKLLVRTRKCQIISLSSHKTIVSNEIYLYIFRKITWMVPWNHSWPTEKFLFSGSRLGGAWSSWIIQRKS